VATTDISTSLPAVTVKPGGTISVRDPDGGNSITGVTIWAIPINPTTGEPEALRPIFLAPSGEDLIRPEPIPGRGD
jgi:hypothetical protein